MKYIALIIIVCLCAATYHFALKSERFEISLTQIGKKHADTVADLNDHIAELDREADQIAAREIELRAELAEARALIENQQADIITLGDPANRPQPTADHSPEPVDFPSATSAAEQSRQAEAARQRADLTARLHIAERTLTDWKTKAEAQEQTWNDQSGVRTSAADKARRRAEITSAITAKQNEIDHLRQQLAR